MTDDAGYGFATTSIKLFCRRIWRRCGTWPRTCNGPAHPATLRSGKAAREWRDGFYWELTGYYRKLGCSIHGEPLGNDYVVACGVDGNGGRAAALNALFDEWRAIRAGEPVVGLVRFGTVDWLFREYKQTKAYLEKVSKRSRRDYERTMLLVATWSRKRATGLAIETSRQSLRSRRTRFMTRSLPAREVCDRARVKKLSGYVLVRGALFIDYIPTFSIEMFRIRGAE